MPKNNNTFPNQGVWIIALVLLSLLVLFFNLGQRSFWEPDEGRYAEISREMVESGDWLTPRLNYIKHFDKPPITYWLIGSSFKFLGQNEFAGHLPLVLIALLGVCATFCLGKTLFGPRCGLLSAIILITCLGYPALARVLSTDIVFSFFCLLSYLFFARRNFLLFYLALGLGFMTKGPVVFVITLIPILTFLLYTKDKALFKQMRLGWGLILFALVALPWYIYQIRINQGLWSDWVLEQTVNRIVRPLKDPFYFFLPVLIGLFFPGIFFLIPALTRNLSFARAKLNPQRKHILLLFFWFALPFVFFSCIGKKLVPYLLPLLPALAIITARFWGQLFNNVKILSSRIFTVCFYIFLFTLVILLLGMSLFLILGYERQLQVELARGNIIAMCILFASAIIISLYLFTTKRAYALFGTISLTSLLFFLATMSLMPKIEISTGKSIKSLALTIKQDLQPQDKIVNYRCFLKSLPFYLGRRTIVVERQRHIAYEESDHWQDYLLKDKQDLYRLLADRKIKVYCITYTWEFDRIEQEYPRPLKALGQAGKYVLFVNKK